MGTSAPTREQGTAQTSAWGILRPVQLQGFCQITAVFSEEPVGSESHTQCGRVNVPELAQSSPSLCAGDKGTQNSWNLVTAEETARGNSSSL